MRPRNEALHAEIDRVALLQLEIPNNKAIAAKFNTTPQSVRVMLSRARRRLKLTIVKLHVEHTGAKMEGEC